MQETLTKLELELANLQQNPEPTERENIIRLNLMELNSKYEYAKMRLLEGKINRGKETMPENIDLRSPDTISHDDRWNLYFYWLELYRTKQSAKVQELNDKLKIKYKKYEEMSQIIDMHCLKRATVIGMTTTCAARCRSIIEALKIEIVFVEEAAEILESHIVASLSKDCKHLILIGDHKQLRPSSADYNIEKNYKLGISLFERMILNNFHCNTLNVQHRMRPEIASLIRPEIYQILKDDPSVEDRPAIGGVKSNLFFIHHENSENSQEGDSSHVNKHEADFCVNFANYLILNDYKPEQVTILAAYLGQMYEIQKRAFKYPKLKGIRIAVVDNYQGEESDIILLSLVRNNDQNSIGFLKIENRVCVALSRARNGLYIMGNIELLSNNSDLWQKIKSKLVAQNALGTALPLVCQNHKDTVTMVKNPDDFTSVSQGGCSAKCGEILSCGHECTHPCHVTDKEHSDRYKCKQICNKQVCTKDNSHICKNLCFEECDPCVCLNQVTLSCGHVAEIPCSFDVTQYGCKELVQIELKCGHKITKLCFDKNENITCVNRCEAVIQPCGHYCRKRCHIFNDPKHLECQAPCENFLKNCQNLKDDNHRCKKLCYEKCGPCEVKVKKQRSCLHVFNVSCTQNVEDLVCENSCTKILSCGHKCISKCFEICDTTKCQFKMKKIHPICGHEIQAKCSEMPDKKFCNKQCPLLLPCGHPCTNRCSQPCTRECKILVTSAIEAECGHIAEMPCYIGNSEDLQKNAKLLTQYCSQRCSAPLKCGHLCSGSCGECFQGRIHKRCSNKCKNLLLCGHSCQLPCGQVCQPCKLKCNYKCEHASCLNKCGEVCTPCKEECARRCEHRVCTKTCGEMCNVAPCEEPCKKLLSCGHPCAGFCGDPCPFICLVCYNDVQLDAGEDAKFVHLSECGHAVDNQKMKESLKSDNESLIGFKVCPICETAIKFTLYGTEIMPKLLYKILPKLKRNLALIL